jgi:plastocyanin
MSHRRRQFLRALGVAGTGALTAGCLGDDGSPGTASPAPTDGGTTPTTTATAGGGAQAQFPDYDWGQLDGVDPQVATTITMTDFAFDPLVARMPPGTELTVENEDSASHTMTVPALGIEETLSAGGSTSFTVEETGTFDYVCEFHGPEMLGRLVVEEGVSTPAGGATDTPTEGDTPTGTATEDDGYY